MTRQTRQPDFAEIEPPLPELARLRELSQLDAPSREVTHALFGRLQNTVSATTRNQRVVPTRAWAVALGILVAVPSAFAATPVGSTLMRQTVDWVNRTFAPADTAHSQREGQRPAASSGSGNHATRVAPAISRAPIEPPTDQASGAGAAIAGFEDIPVQAPTPSGGPSYVQRTSAGPQAVSSGSLPSAGSSVVRDVGAPRGITDTVGSGTLNAERQLLEQARARLRAGDAHGALGFTSRHESMFPGGILEHERLAIINQAHALESAAP